MSRTFNRSLSTIHSLYRKYNATGSVDDLRRSPRGRVTTRQQDRYMFLSHLRNRDLTARDTARRTMGLHNRAASDQLVRNRLRSMGLRARRPYVGTVLTDRHRQLRLQWARRHLRNTRADWARVLFTDESKFNLRISDGRARVYLRRGKRFSDNCVRERGQFGGGSVIIWGGISLHTKSQIVHVVGNLNAIRYQNLILRPVAVPHIRRNRGMILMQDNATCHTARSTTQMLQQNNIRTLNWPPCSPDLNPIEHVWDEIDRRVRRLPTKRNIGELLRDITNVWNRLPQHYLHINSMRQVPSRDTCKGWTYPLLICDFYKTPVT